MNKLFEKISSVKKITLIFVLFAWAVSLPIYAQLAPKANNKGKYGYANVNGEFIIKPQFDYAGDFSDDIACVRKGKKWGYIDIQGNPVIDIKYEAIQNGFTDGLAWVKLKNKYGYVNNKGDQIIPLKYANAYPFSDGCAAVVVKEKNKFLFGYINTAGNEIVEPIYEHCIARFAHGRSAIKKDGKWAIINTKGEQITGFEYLNVIISPKNKGYIIVTKDGAKDNEGGIQSGNWGIMNNDGKLITPLKYHAIRNFNDENLILVSSGDSWGWVNMQGEEIIPLKHKQVLDFNEGLAAILENGKVNWINAKNETVLKTDYTGTTYFENGVAYVKDRYGKWGSIDKKGNIVVPLIADSYREAVDVYARYGQKPLTKRHVKQYLLHKNRPQDKYKVKDTIPEDMWDF
ncbi:MAG: WG repeat-containing protein [Bacteroidetes bacterium]|nr:WG repeat-containing protein [Bacteroidota bacterium]MCL2303348.1 WG repeat-containing protein [Lentimicrobiaceae bacterium]